MRANVRAMTDEERRAHLREKYRQARRNQNERAKALRRALIAALGGTCALCGSQDRLELDHEDGRTWDVSKIGFPERVKRYVAEYEAGVPLRALCRPCNGKSGGGLRYGGAVRGANGPVGDDMDDIPF